MTEPTRIIALLLLANLVLTCVTLGLLLARCA
jgi:hypothetical protein